MALTSVWTNIGEQHPLTIAYHFFLRKLEECLKFERLETSEGGTNSQIQLHPGSDSCSLILVQIYWMLCSPNNMPISSSTSALSVLYVKKFIILSFYIAKFRPLNLNSSITLFSETSHFRPNIFSFPITICPDKQAFCPPGLLLYIIDDALFVL